MDGCGIVVGKKKAKLKEKERGIVRRESEKKGRK